MRTAHDYLNEVAHTTKTFFEPSEEESKKLKEVLLEMYKDISNVCKKNQLNVMLAYGSCLGAIRHNGFIPWDDDLDIMLPRADYEKFSSLFDSELSDKYELSGWNRSYISGLYMRVYKKGTKFSTIFDSCERGIFVDVYAIDYMPDNTIIRKMKCFYLDFLRFAIGSRSFKFSNTLLWNAYKKTVKTRILFFIRTCIGLVFGLFKLRTLNKYFNKVSSTSKGRKYVSVLAGRDSCGKECHPSSVFFPPKVASFESLTVLVPNKTECYLSRLYGDYMAIPPVEKRERHFYLILDFGD